MCPNSKVRNEFQSSRDLKVLFGQLFDEWQKKTREGIEGLATRCGVTPAYLAHVRRYGRVPGRPVLILLALNFGVDGRKLFEAAKIRESYPYEPNVEILKPEKNDPGLLSIRLDMDGFTEAIRNVVHAEIKQRSLRDVLGKRPLKIGLNYLQFWMYDSPDPPRDKKYQGVFPDFCRMLAVSLQREVEIIQVPFADYISMMEAGELDIFGPTLMVPNLPSQILFSRPLYRLGISALMRLRETPDLEPMPGPKTLNDLRQGRFQIAVLRNSLAHILANTLLKRDDAGLVICDSDMEALDRIMLRGVKKPSHIFLTNSLTALALAKKSPKEIQALFVTRDTILDMADTALAIRPDWPELVPTINDAIKFLLRRGGFSERIEQVMTGEMRQVVEVLN